MKTARNFKKLVCAGGLLCRIAHSIDTVFSWIALTLFKVFCRCKGIRITGIGELTRKHLSTELDLVRRAIVVHRGEYSVLPDGDFVVYRKARSSGLQVLAILYAKDSVRAGSAEATWHSGDHPRYPLLRVLRLNEFDRTVQLE